MEAFLLKTINSNYTRNYKKNKIINGSGHHVPTIYSSSCFAHKVRISETKRLVQIIVVSPSSTAKR